MYWGYVDGWVMLMGSSMVVFVSCIWVSEKISCANGLGLGEGPSAMGDRDWGKSMWVWELVGV